MSITAVSQVLAGVSNAVTSAAQPASSGIADFSSLLESMGKDAVNNFKTAESKSMAALSGDGSTREVVEAVMSAEQTLQIAVGVRDKIVSAYLELSRMAI
jgi:flagellar hook-basal body complex protein FliE